MRIYLRKLSKRSKITLFLKMNFLMKICKVFSLLDCFNGFYTTRVWIPCITMRDLPACSAIPVYCGTTIKKLCQFGNAVGVGIVQQYEVLNKSKRANFSGANYNVGKFSH